MPINHFPQTIWWLDRLLLTLVGIQLSWPDYYQRFREAVVSEDVQDPFKVLMEAVETPTLVRYAKLVLSTDVSEDTLRQVFELAEVVHTDLRAAASHLDPFAASEEPPAPQRVERNRNVLHDELSYWGYRLGAAIIILRFRADYGAVVKAQA